MFTYGLTRHRTALLVGGALTLAASFVRLVMHKDAEGVYLQGDGNDKFIGMLVVGCGWLLLLSGVAALWFRASATRGLLIAFAIAWLVGQNLLAGSSVRWLSGFLPKQLSIGVIVVVTMQHSQFALLILALLLLAGVGSTTRVKAEPYDEYFVRERVAGGFSGYAFAASLASLGFFVVLWISGFLRMKEFTSPSGTDEWLTATETGMVLVSALLGLAGWGIMLARQRFAGLLLALFAGGILAALLLDVARMQVLEMKYGKLLNDPWSNWPPVGLMPSLLTLVEHAGVAVPGIVWGMQYYRSPRPIDPGSGFEPMIGAK